MNLLWSRFNTLFTAEKGGHYLFNAQSGVLLELDRNHYFQAQSLKDKKGDVEADLTEPFFLLLKESLILVDEGFDVLWVEKQQNLRKRNSFNSDTLGLVICPTLACNFSCSYCFESANPDNRSMDEATATQLIRFVQWHKDARNVLVTWYGGEPTLGFTRIIKLTKALQKQCRGKYDANLITNGYLLDKRKVDLLDSLHISNVQITLDGMATTHDRRRPHKNGQPTFQRIFDVIHYLLHSTYSGKVNLRINIDHTNCDEYPDLVNLLKNTFSQDRLNIYPGHINVVPGNHHTQCALCGDSWLDFARDGYFQHHIIPQGGLFPNPQPFTLCTATSLNGYVVGPGGELYKCWEDVGKPTMCIGHVSAPETLEESELMWRYIKGTDPFSDTACLHCHVLPVCGGGCPNKRLRVQQFGEEGMEYCAFFKDRLERCLEVYCDLVRTRELCQALLEEVSLSERAYPGYRMIQPEA